MIEVKNLTKRYGEKLAVDNASFTVNAGEIVGFLGGLGAVSGNAIADEPQDHGHEHDYRLYFFHKRHGHGGRLRHSQGARRG